MHFLDRFFDKVCYHISDSDLDGVSCRLIAEYFIKPITKEYIPLNTGNRDMSDFEWEIAKKADIILFTDITPPNLEFYSKLLDLNKFIIICDHHQSSKDILGDFDNYIFDLSRSANKIFYDELTKGKRRRACLDQYITLSNTYDLYETDSVNWENAKGLHNILYGYVNWRAFKYETDTERHRKFLDIQLEKFRRFDNFFFSVYEKRIIQNAIKKEDTAYKQAKKNLDLRVDGEDNPYAFTAVDSKISLTAHRLMNELGNKIKYIVMYSNFNYKKNGVHSLSLRSSNDFDVRYIAEKHLGGGHKNSAGIKINDSNFANNFISGIVHLL